jgi:hypothetical protein
MKDAELCISCFLRGCFLPGFDGTSETGTCRQMVSIIVDTNGANARRESDFRLLPQATGAPKSGADNMTQFAKELTA